MVVIGAEGNVNDKSHNDVMVFSSHVRHRCGALGAHANTIWIVLAAEYYDKYVEVCTLH